MWDCVGRRGRSQLSATTPLPLLPPRIVEPRLVGKTGGTGQILPFLASWLVFGGFCRQSGSRWVSPKEAPFPLVAAGWGMWGSTNPLWVLPLYFPSSLLTCKEEWAKLKIKKILLWKLYPISKQPQIKSNHQTSCSSACLLVERCCAQGSARAFFTLQQARVLCHSAQDTSYCRCKVVGKKKSVLSKLHLASLLPHPALFHFTNLANFW